MATPYLKRPPVFGPTGILKPQKRPRFFAAHGGKMITGNEKKLSPIPDDPEVEREIRNLFAGFERAIGGETTVELTDPKTREALEALGYIDAEPTAANSPE